MRPSDGVFVITGEQLRTIPGLRKTIARDDLPGARHRHLLTSQGMDLEARHYTMRHGQDQVYVNADSEKDAMQKLKAYLIRTEGNK